MPNYTVLRGRLAKQGHIYEEGDKVTLDDDEAAPLLENGMLEPVRRGRPPGSGKTRKSGWTRSDDDTDDGDDAEGGDD